MSYAKEAKPIVVYLLGALTLSCLGLAQVPLTGAIKGEVRSRASQNPLSGVNVTVRDSTLNPVKTDSEGRFELQKVPAGVQLVEFSSDGYRALTQSDIRILPNQAVTLEITLVPEFTKQETVTVTSGLFEGEQGAASTYQVTPEEVKRSAGTWGDIGRYLQALPGVVLTSEQRNDLIVRGGNPIENLSVVDGVEVPNINNFAILNTTGGTSSMLNIDAIQDIHFTTGAMPAYYEDRLSSVLEIAQRSGDHQRTQGKIEAGFEGGGVLVSGPLTPKLTYLVSARRSFIDFFIKDLGIGGVPVYSNYLTKVVYDATPRDKISTFGLAGVDTIRVRPTKNTISRSGSGDIQYHGWRDTAALTWQHAFNSSLYSVASVADSEQHQDTTQDDLLFNGQRVYSEKTTEASTTVKYDLFGHLGSLADLRGGVREEVDRVNFNVSQPLGMQSPYNLNPSRMDAFAFNPHFATAHTSSYVDAVLHPLPRLTLQGGLRFSNWQYTHTSLALPRASAAFAVTPFVGLHVAYGEYAQLPPFIYLTAVPENSNLRPIKARHIVVGGDWLISDSLRISLEAYRKDYSKYPVATQYPALSIANIGGELYGVANLILPLTSAGKGQAKGIELAMHKRMTKGFYGESSLAVSKAEFAGSDGVLRRSNYDHPVILSLIGGWIPNRKWEASVKFAYLTGRPYTPFLEPASQQQNRAIFDLSKVNAVRASDYVRLDFRVDRHFVFRRFAFSVYGGLQNALGRKNFLDYDWDSFMNRPHELTQFPRFPIGGFDINF